MDNTLHTKILTVFTTLLFIITFVFLHWYAGTRPDFEAIAEKHKLDVREEFYANVIEGAPVDSYQPVDDKYHLGSGRELLWAGSNYGAIGEMKRELKKGNNPDALYYIGVAQERAGELSKAKQSYQACLNIGQDTWIEADAMINLIRVCIKLNVSR